MRCAGLKGAYRRASPDATLRLDLAPRRSPSACAEKLSDACHQFVSYHGAQYSYGVYRYGPFVSYHGAYIVMAYIVMADLLVTMGPI